MTKTNRIQRGHKVAILAICTLAFAWTTEVALCETNKGAPDMVLTTAKAKKPAIFPHATHQKTLECSKCHHGKNADGTRLPYQEGQVIVKCITCHNKKDMANSKLNNFKKAAHAMCKSCHSTFKKEGKATGPTKCSGCHVKKK